MLKRTLSLLLVVSLLSLFAAGAAGAGPTSNRYRVSKLVSDVAGRAALPDKNLVNAWGLAAGPATPWWVANNGTSTSTLYSGAGAIVPLVVKVGGAPTGAVFNGSSDFVVTHHGHSGPSLFLFSTEGGRIRGWNPAVPPGSTSTRAFTVVDNSGADAIYKGLALASSHHGNLLYATDFHNGRVDVFNGSFAPVHAGSFVDPTLPSGYAPFGIQNIGGTLFVTFAKQDPAAEDEIAGHGLGFVDMFNPAGKFLGRVATRGALNAPWGLALAPSDFGRFSGDLLVGNFGNGKINAYGQESSGAYVPRGTLTNGKGNPISIDGLWALEFGNGDQAGPKNSLYFTAGPNEESHGLFGNIEAAG